MNTDNYQTEPLNDLPECRTLAGWNVAGVLRFEMDRSYAVDLRDQVQQVKQQPNGGFVDVVFILDYRAMASLTEGLAELHSAHQETGEVASKQVVVTPDEQDVAVTVALNASQIESSMKKNYLVLKQITDKRHQFGHEFSLSENAAEMLEQQLDAFLDGAENPLDHVEDPA